MTDTPKSPEELARLIIAISRKDWVLIEGDIAAALAEKDAALSKSESSNLQMAEALRPLLEHVEEYFTFLVAERHLLSDAKAALTGPSVHRGRKMKLRKSVQAFAELMELKLRKNNYRNGYYGLSLEFLRSRLQEEVAELEEALPHVVDVPGWVAREAADVANFAMFFALNSGGVAEIEAALKTSEPGTQGRE